MGSEMQITSANIFKRIINSKCFANCPSIRGLIMTSPGNKMLKYCIFQKVRTKQKVNKTASHRPDANRGRMKTGGISKGILPSATALSLPLSRRSSLVHLFRRQRSSFFSLWGEKKKFINSPAAPVASIIPIIDIPPFP